MNKLCLTKRGLLFFTEDQNQSQEMRSSRLMMETKRSSSLPQLISQASITQRQALTGRLSRLTSQAKGIKEKGLRKIFQQKQDEQLTLILQEQFSNRKEYLQKIVPMLVKKTRGDNNNFGNLQSRVERGRAYLQRLSHNFEHKFVFRPPQKPVEQ